MYDTAAKKLSNHLFSPETMWTWYSPVACHVWRKVKKKPKQRNVYIDSWQVWRNPLR